MLTTGRYSTSRSRSRTRHALWDRPRLRKESTLATIRRVESAPGASTVHIAASVANVTRSRRASVKGPPSPGPTRPFRRRSATSRNGTNIACTTAPIISNAHIVPRIRCLSFLSAFDCAYPAAMRPRLLPAVVAAASLALAGCEASAGAWKSDTGRGCVDALATSYAPPPCIGARFTIRQQAAEPAALGGRREPVSRPRARRR